MEVLQTIALLCKISAGADSVHVTDYAIKKQLECQQYYVKCVDPVGANYKTLAKCISEKKY